MANTTQATSIALVGDFQPAAIAHRAIPEALALCGASGKWIPTSEVSDPARTLANSNGIWLVPASPYKRADGAFAAVRYARESQRPFLGSCGGFQHALIEIARNVAGIHDADHAETAKPGRSLVVTAMVCGLVEKTQRIRLLPGTILQKAYAAAEIIEEYHCNYGVAEEYRDTLAKAGVKFTGFDEAGDIRAFELPSHRFFVGTLFQSERRALKGEAPPLVKAFVEAARQTL